MRQEISKDNKQKSFLSLFVFNAITVGFCSLTEAKELVLPLVHANINLSPSPLSTRDDAKNETFYAMYHRKLGQRFEGPTNKIMGTSYKLSSMDSPAWSSSLGQPCWEINVSVGKTSPLLCRRMGRGGNSRSVLMPSGPTFP
ncbi:hypothetical protein CEXT_640041 [Caerostris extrusa]|uniref:Uncharacterized protein n=1 Tax=Caerostris extrusa TaxID=172846 RepID=A0AAV4XYI2_CAEEX|nr:hypothetical protein CEXT_640041 [Caerostris extrusa]